jgi:hypothetical protein
MLDRGADRECRTRMTNERNFASLTDAKNGMQVNLVTPMISQPAACAMSPAAARPASADNREVPLEDRRFMRHIGFDFDGPEPQDRWR